MCGTVWPHGALLTNNSYDITTAWTTCTTTDKRHKRVHETISHRSACCLEGSDLRTQLSSLLAKAFILKIGLAGSLGSIAVCSLRYLVMDVVEKVVKAVREYNSNEFIGIFDAISTPGTYAHDLEILARFKSAHLACVHPPPDDVPSNIKAGMIFGVNDVADPVWENYVTLALEQGKIRCLPPPTIVGKGLEHINDALKRSKAGVSATKLVIEL